jgi:hypothetical protein
LIQRRWKAAKEMESRKKEMESQNNRRWNGGIFNPSTSKRKDNYCIII